MSRQEKAKYAMGEEHPSLSSLPVNLGKKPQCFRDKMLHSQPERHTLLQVSAALTLRWCLKIAPW